MAELLVKGRRHPCRAVLFDKDGTLLDFWQMWGPWTRTLLEMLEQELQVLKGSFTGPKHRVLGTTHNADGEPMGYDRRGPLAMGSIEETTAVLAWQLYAAGKPWNEAVLRVRELASVATQEIRQQRPASLPAGLLSLLQQCHQVGIVMGVVTADGTKEAEEHLHWLGIHSYFATVVGYDQVVHSKPDPAMMLHACAQLRVSPSETVLIGDTNGDMQMGRLAGAALKIGYAAESETATYLLDADDIIHSYDEIIVRQSLV
ncbi:HAD family hydrolase [Paenibacillus massiliensis]|uniref:HAD family hydrolase n=1 Tax=Paenibacillus massiliensis TaxID=225917 RepID=UPI0004709EA4|nr:HAD family hydrolase [Paenibacillus massiliensis]